MPGSRAGRDRIGSKFALVLAVELVSLVGAFGAIRDCLAADWVHLSSRSGDLLPPNENGAQQVNSLIFDVDQDGMNDFVVGERTGSPGVVWFRRLEDGWERFVIDSRQTDVTSSAAFYDLDRDGDLDVLMGGSFASNEIWWWENPYPDFDPASPWIRHTIKSTGGNQHHDVLFGDFDSDGDDELVFWTLRPEYELFIGDIPDDPRTAPPWEFTRIFTSGTSYSEGLAADDIDLDGRTDIIAGGFWFEHLSDYSFEAHPIAPSRSLARVAVGQLVEGGRPEVVLVDGHGTGPLEWYEWDGEEWIPRALVDTVVRGHSLAIDDINGDGFLDIFSAEMRQNGANPDARTWVFYGDGAGHFEEEVVATGIGTHGSRVGDLDADGDLDILGVPYNWDTPRLDVWLQDGTEPRDLVSFIRGDADADGAVGLNDAVFCLHALFFFDVDPPCFRALDVNESGDVDLSDAISILILLFRPEIGPLAPLDPECRAVSPGGLSCQSFPPCEDTVP